jgi:hypothetical protein
MRFICLLLFLLIEVPVLARIYYVAPTGGNDNNPGTLSQPWATWQKAFNTVQPGDTVYFRGGVWYPKRGVDINYYHKSKSGTRTNPICYFNYPGEMPVLDCRNFETVTHSRSGLDIFNSTYLKFRGLTIKNVRQTTMDQEVTGITVTNKTGGVLWFDNVTTCYNGGVGFSIAGYDTLYLKNCDSYRNADTLRSGGPGMPNIGGKADGFNITSAGTAADTFKIAYISGCRSWDNTDDGWDVSTTKQYDWHHCWAWNNGSSAYKLAHSHVKTASKRRIYKCLSATTSVSLGYDPPIGTGFFHCNLVEAEHGIYNQIFNCTSFNLRTHYYQVQGSFDADLVGAHCHYANNLHYITNNDTYPGTNIVTPAAFMAGKNNSGHPWAWVHLNNNSFIPFGDYGLCQNNPSFNVTSSDFVSLDTVQLRAPRKGDGSLPEITFLNLNEGSDLIDSGADVGLSYNGTAPDIGYSEFNKSPKSLKKYADIEIVSPYNNSTVRNLSIKVLVSVNDPERAVSKIELFYDNFIKIGEASTPESENKWAFEWRNAPLGTHKLRAVATDNENSKSTSAIINIIIIPKIDLKQARGILYPNPSKGIYKLYLEEPLGEDSYLTISTLNGSLVYSKRIYGEERITEFNLSDLKSGMYILILSNKEIIFTQKLIKM